jgi:hypothetical protein
LVPVKSPLSTNALKDWEQVPFGMHPEGMGPIQPHSGSYPSRKSKMLAKNTRLGVSSIDSESGSSKLAMAG